MRRNKKANYEERKYEEEKTKREEAEERERQAKQETIRVEREFRKKAEAYAERERKEKLKAEMERDQFATDAEEARTGLVRESRAREKAEKKMAKTKEALERLELDFEAVSGKVRPIIDVTESEIRQKKVDLEFKKGLFHVAVAGCAGSGKSSLINAFRGLSNHSPGAAAVDVVETTSTVTRYPDPNPANHLVWYDVPGTGTLDVPDWEYFNDQGLFVFDAIIVLFDSRFTEKDFAIIRNCVRNGIPVYIVRSKSRQHMQNVVDDLPPVEGEDESQRRARARQEYIRETRKDVNHYLNSERLRRQPLYLVDKQTILQLVTHRQPEEPIDEQKLLRDLLTRAKILLGIP